MAELKKHDDREFEKVDGGWIAYNHCDKAWEAFNDEDYSLLGSFPGSYDDAWAKRDAQACAVSANQAPCEAPWWVIKRGREASQ